MQLNNHVQTPSSPETSALAATLDVLKNLLDEENVAFENRQLVDHAIFIDRKNQLLRDLILLQRRLAGSGELLKVKTHVAELMPVLQRNHELLKSNIDALGEVTKIIRTAELEEDADGTYSRIDRVKAL